MKYLFCIMIALVLSACEKRTVELGERYTLPSELKHCKVYRMETNSVGRDITVVHCPNAATTTQHRCGKSCTAENVIIAE